MLTNWQDVPRDPIADDDELEYLYQVAELQKSIPVADPTMLTGNRMPRLERLKKREKVSLRGYRDSGPGKLASIALLVRSCFR
jgi:hypothetical protein